MNDIIGILGEQGTLSRSIAGFTPRKAQQEMASAIEKAIDRDNWMTAEEALEFGLLDKIVTSMKDVEALLR